MGQEHIEDVYFIEGIKNIFLSINVCKKLRIVHESFPLPIPMENTAIKEEDPIVIPSRPDKIPFEPLEKNIPALKQWLIDAFANTVFLSSEETLPKMRCKEHHIHLEEGAVPHAVHSPIPTPHHWREAVPNLLNK